jgi:radical SAM superfamily enzyme YgiQ (UPF0313 family)
MKLIAGKKFLLLYPGYFSEKWGRTMRIKPHMIYVHNFLKKYFETSVVDLDIEFLFPNSEEEVDEFKKKSLEKILSQDFDYLGISCFVSTNYLPTKYFAEEVKKHKPNVKIIVGGYHATAMPEDFIYENNPFDKVIEGDINNMLEIIDNDNNFYKSNNDSIIGKPDFLSYPYYSSKDINLGIFLSTGCPYNCSFCMEYNNKRKCLDVEEAIEYVSWIENNLSTKLICFFDPLFGQSSKWRKRFLQGLIDKKIKSWIWLFTRIDILDEEDIKLFSKLNIMVKFGIESFSKEMLTIMNKTTNPEKYLNSFIEISKLCNKYRVLHDAFLIYNHPGESLRTIKENRDFFDNKIKKELIEGYLRIESIKYSLYPGSSVYNNMDFYEQTYGSIFPEKKWWKKENECNLANISRSIIASKNGEKEIFIKEMNKFLNEIDRFNKLSREQSLWTRIKFFSFRQSRLL